MKIKNKYNPSQISSELYKDTFDGLTSCDLIIKCGSNLFEYTAHRAILAAASDFLKDALLTAIPGTISVLILPDIEPQTLKLILNFIYNGEITLDMKKDYGKFIEACQLLKIQEPIMMQIEEDEVIFEENSPGNFVDLVTSSDEEMDENMNEPPDLMPMNEFHPTSIALDFPAPIKILPKPCKIGKYRRESIKKLNFSALSTKETEIVLDKAKTTIYYVYSKANRKPDMNLDGIIEETKLIYNKEGTLVAASHKCAFCQGDVKIIRNKGSASWSNATLWYHLRTQHGIEHVQKSS